MGQRFTMETVACALCGAADAPAVVTQEFFGQAFTFVRCTECGLVYQNPRPTGASLRTFYDSADYQHSAVAGYDDYAAGRAHQEATARRRLRWMARLQPGPRRTLEIGSGGGSFIAESRAAGHETDGIELSPGFADLARDRYDIALRVADIAHVPLPADTYDRVCAWGTVGNLHDPGAVFAAVAAALRPGGWFFCNFFDIDHWTAALRGARYFRYVPSATYNYSRITLPQLLERAGLHVRHIKTEWQVSSLGKAVGFLRAPALLALVQRLGLAHANLLVPTLNGYLLAAQLPESKLGALSENTPHSAE